MTPSKNLTRSTLVKTYEEVPNAALYKTNRLTYEAYYINYKNLLNNFFSQTWRLNFALGQQPLTPRDQGSDYIPESTGLHLGAVSGVYMAIHANKKLLKVPGNIVPGNRGPVDVTSGVGNSWFGSWTMLLNIKT